MNLTIEGKRKYLFDPKEEVSYILEFRIYWLMYILTFKNPSASEYLTKELNFMDYIENQSEKYLTLLEYHLKTIDKNKEKGFPDAKIECITKSMKKFCELVYYLFFQDKTKLRLILSKKHFVNFHSLRNSYDDNRVKFYPYKSEDFDVFIWFKKLEKEIKNETS